MTKRTMLAAGIAATLGLVNHASAEGDASQSQQQPTQQPGEQQAQETAEPAGSQMTEERAAGAQASGFENVDHQQVRELQRQLQARGLYEGNIDGIVGPLTRSALRQFQEQEGLEATGTWNSNTAAALGVQEGERQPVRGTEQSQGAAQAEREPGMEAQRFQLSTLSPEQIQDIQRRLQELGHYTGEVDGIVGPRTRGALQAFFRQQAQLAAQGMLSDAAVAAFGMDPQEIEPVRGMDSEQAEPGVQGQSGTPGQPGAQGQPGTPGQPGNWPHQEADGPEMGGEREQPRLEEEPVQEYTR